MVFVYLFFFVIGIIFGSFFNVVGLRVPKKRSIVQPRSHCPHCGHFLSWYELIPIFSYVLQKGKCRSCRVPISAIYPVMELFTGLLFVFSFYKIGFSKELIVALPFVSLLIIITVSDLSYKLIPNRILIFFFVLFIFLRIWIPLHPWYDSIIGMTVGFILLYIIAIVSNGGMGGGDIKLFAVLGYALGLKGVLLAFFLSTLIGALFGLFGIITKQLSRKSAIPFGPFISIGAVLSYFYETEIFHWYIQLII
ncbi:prepilin peptidase [Aeribacillus sp. FSL K6-1121]|uniref:prepilin peptidase n=1 Tax=Aeribacillus TaxID=1055323 RepID=UPI0007B4BE0D|nr:MULTISPECIES: A24 family peptidase [Aeribacillus]KZM56336.1 prepilin peptidase [Aeribacillus pallidus]MED0650219.1 prepilin peptidase [Aeribacillus composti]MED4485673.1 prepilin peptidase [Aeribacillus pallidus]